MARLDEIEVEVYWFIDNFIEEHTHPPTVREIGDGCYMSRTRAQRYIDRLDAHGYIIHEPGKARGITLTGKKPRL